MSDFFSDTSRPDEATFFDLKLALTETFANIIDHSYGNDPDKTLTIQLSLEDDSFEIIFEDYGERPLAVDLKSRNLDDYRERGLGLFLMSRCMDDVDFSFGSDGRNRLRMRRALGERTERMKEHHPFHVAVYEDGNSKKICLIGTFDRSRSNPFDKPAISSSERTLLDLSGLDFIDSYGMKCLSDFFRAAASKGHRVSFAGTSESIGKVFGETGLIAGAPPASGSEPNRQEQLSGLFFAGRS